MLRLGGDAALPRPGALVVDVAVGVPRALRVQAARLLAEFVAVAPQEYDDEAKNNATGVLMWRLHCVWL